LPEELVIDDLSAIERSALTFRACHLGEFCRALGDCTLSLGPETSGDARR
jgi:hypothetical protein